MRLKTLFLVILSACCLSASAQDVFISIDEVPSLNCDDISLGKCAGAVFLAKEAHFTVSSSNHGDVVTQEGKHKDGRYIYKVVCDVSQNRDRTFTVVRTGTALRQEKKKYLTRGELIFFEIKEAEHRIVLNRQVTRDQLYAVEGKACLEFTVPFTGMQLHFSPAIGTLLQPRSLEGGAQLLALEIDIKALHQLRDKVQSAQKAYDDFQAKADAAEEFTDAMAAEEKRLEQQRDQAVADYASAQQVSLYSDKSNEVYVDAADMQSLGAKMKLQYGVLDMFQKVGSTAFAEKLILANQAAESRRFKEAADAYRVAAQDKDATKNDKQTCEARASTMEKCLATRNEANRALQMIQAYKKQGEAVDADKLVSLFELAIAHNEQLFAMTNDDYFQDRANQLKVSRDKIGIVVRGTVLTTRVKQGRVTEEPIVGIDIYGVATAKTEAMERGTHGDFLGSVTNADGSFQVQVPRGAYKGLLFVPTNNNKYKDNVWQGLKAGQHTQLKVRFKK